MGSQKFVIVFVLCAIMLLVLMPTCKSSEGETQEQTEAIEDGTNELSSDSDMSSVMNGNGTTGSVDNESGPRVPETTTETDYAEQAPLLSEQDGFRTCMHGDWGWQVPIPVGFETKWQYWPSDERGALAIFDSNAASDFWAYTDHFGVRVKVRRDRTASESLEWELLEDMPDDYQKHIWAECEVSGRQAVHHVYSYTWAGIGFTDDRFEPDQIFKVAEYGIWCWDFTTVVIYLHTKAECFDELLPTFEWIVAGFRLVD